MGANVVTVSDGDFDAKVLKATQPTLVDFWAEWCAPCRAIAPIVSELADQYAGRLQVAKINIDEHPETPTQYAVRAIPTLLIFKDGRVVDQIVGLVSKSKLNEVVSRHL